MSNLVLAFLKDAMLSIFLGGNPRVENNKPELMLSLLYNICIDKTERSFCLAVVVQVLHKLPIFQMHEHEDILLPFA